MSAQDPDERFDLVDGEGRPLGRTKRRADVHRDGDWHRAIHLWVVNATGARPWVLLQRRSAAKDTWPGRLDVSVAGHLGAGESPDDALREADEEVGLRVTASQVRWLGRAAKVLPLPDGGCDREVIDVYATRTDRELDAFAPHPDEVAALVAVDLDDARALWEGTLDRARGRCLDARGSAPRATTVTRSELCAPDGGLRARALASLRAWIDGAPLPPWPFP